MSLRGRATASGTARFAARYLDAKADFFHRLGDRTVSAVGLGTYLGDADERTDRLYDDAIEAVLANGCNVLDAAANYRSQRSERTIGGALERLVGRDSIARDEIVVCTKAGYLPFDGDVPTDPSGYLIDTFLRPGIIQYDDLVAGCHCISPRYLAHQLHASLHNLRVETIDVYYLHNPEQQLDEVPRETFLQRMEAAFRFLEEKVGEGTIGCYGTATWNGYRVNAQSAGYLSLSELCALAERVAGHAHHFRAIQLPYNLAMPEAYAFKNQVVDGQTVNTLDAAARLGVDVVASASLLQSRLVRLPASMARWLPDSETDAQRALQFVRSTPGVAVALVGMKQRAHVEQNLRVRQQAALPKDRLDRLFARGSQKSSH